MHEVKDCSYLEFNSGVQEDEITKDSKKELKKRVLKFYMAQPIFDFPCLSFHLQNN